MANQFDSILVRIGLNTDGVKAAFANALNMAEEFRGKFQKMLKGAGLRGPAKFLGPAAVLYGMREAYQLATEKAKELSEAQQKAIDNQIKLAEQFRGTGQGVIAWQKALDLTTVLDADTRAMLQFQQQTKQLGDGFADIATVGISSLTRVGREIGYLGRSVIDVLPSWLGGRGLTTAQSTKAIMDDRVRDISGPRLALQKATEDAKTASDKAAAQKVAHDRERLESSRQDKMAASLPATEQMGIASEQLSQVKGALGEHEGAQGFIKQKSAELDELQKKLEAVADAQDHWQAALNENQLADQANPMELQKFIAEYSAAEVANNQAILDLKKARGVVENEIAGRTQISLEAQKDGVTVEDKVTEYMTRQVELEAKLTSLAKENKDQLAALADAREASAEAARGEIPIAEQLEYIEKKIAEAKYAIADSTEQDTVAQTKANQDLAHWQEQKNTLQAKQKEIAEKIKDTSNAIRLTDDKSVSLVKEKFQATKDLADAQAAYEAVKGQGTQDELDKLEEVNRLKNKGLSLENEINEKKKEGRNLQAELAQLQRNHDESVLEKLAPSDAEIKSGQRGTDRQRSMESKADEDERKAREAYDDAARINSKYTNRETGEFDPALAGDKGQYKKDSGQLQKDLADAQRLAGEADTLRGGAGSKEGIQAALTNQTYIEHMTKLRTEISDLKKLAEQVPVQ